MVWGWLKISKLYELSDLSISSIQIPLRVAAEDSI